MDITSFNIGRYEQGLRYLVAFGLIVLVQVVSIAPVWLALFAAYIVLTGIMRWDPFYAGFESLFGRRFTHRPVPLHTKLAH